MLRHECGSTPDDLHILRAHGDSIEFTVEADRLVVDVLRRWPATGNLAVLWDWLGPVVKRVEAVSGSNPAEFRLTSPNPVYEPYAVSAHDLHMVGMVVWVIEKG